MKILLALDGSEYSQVALAETVVLARRWKAELLLVRCIDTTLPAGGGAARAVGRHLDEERASGESYLAAIASRFPDVATRSFCLHASPREALPRVAEEEQVELMVMASHGRSGLKRLLLGSVAEAVLRQSPCPVLLMREATSAPEQEGFNKVLVPLDGSDAFQEVLASIRSYLAPQAEILLVTAGASCSEAELNSIQVAGHRVDYRIIDGPPEEAITITAEENGCDLIAMSTRGRNGLGRFLKGSITENVARQAPCPVLAFRRNP